MSADKIQYNGGLTISIPVSNLDAAIDWYQKNLDFTLLYKVDEIGWCEMSSPVQRVNVGLGEVEKPEPGGPTPTFGVEDIEVAKANLEAKGIRLDGDIVTYEGMVRLVTFYDLDDNSLMFYEELTGNE